MWKSTPGMWKSLAMCKSTPGGCKSTRRFGGGILVGNFGREFLRGIFGGRILADLLVVDL